MLFITSTVWTRAFRGCVGERHVCVCVCVLSAAACGHFIWLKLSQVPSPSNITNTTYSRVGSAHVLVCGSKWQGGQLGNSCDFVLFCDQGRTDGHPKCGC